MDHGKGRGANTNLPGIVHSHLHEQGESLMTSTRTPALVILAITVIASVTAGCRSTPDVVLWGPCTPGNDPTGTDGRWAMVCRNGEWVPVMSAEEFVRISRGEPNVVIGPLPKRAAPTTTTTTVASTTTSTTTSTTAPAPAPTLTSISPSAGPAAGGATVTITGTNLTGATSVTVGGTAAVGVVVNSATSLTVTTPAHAAGSVDVVVTTVGGTATLVDAYTYVAAPTLTNVLLKGARPTGGTVTYLVGTNFTGDTSVTIGGAAATVEAQTSTSLTVRVPAAAAGVVDVSVSTAGGTATLADSFFYVNSPTITSISPSVGPAQVGTIVTITGTEFYPGMVVAVGGEQATEVVVSSGTQLTATLPDGLGTVDVSVYGVAGSAVLADAFTYVP